MRSRQRRILILNPDFIDFLKSLNGTVSWPTDETIGDVLIASNPAVPAQSILASSTYPGAELLAQGGSGWWDVVNWTALNGATLSNPSAGVLRVTATGSPFAGAGQNVLTSPKRFKTTGITAGDGTIAPAVSYAGTGAPNEFAGTTSTADQPISFEEEAVAAQIQLFNLNGTTGYTEWKAMSVREVNPLNGDIVGAAITPTSGVRFPYARTYNGTTTYTDIYSAELNSVLDPTDFSFGIFIQKDTWDTTERDLFSLDVDANNYIRCTDTTTAGTIQFDFMAGGTLESITYATGSPTGWFMLDLTVTGGNLIASFNGAVVGIPQAVAGTFTGNLASAVVGARTTTPTFVHLGDLSVPYMGMLRSFTQSEKLTIAQKAGVV